MCVRPSAVIGRPIEASTIGTEMTLAHGKPMRAKHFAWATARAGGTVSPLRQCWPAPRYWDCATILAAPVATPAT
jgi:hypothetical protein